MLIIVMTYTFSYIIIKYYFPRSHWIGLYTDHPCDDCPGTTACETCRNGWRWLNGDGYRYQNWHIGQPNENFACIMMTYSGLWADRPCTSLYASICKIKGDYRMLFISDYYE